MTTAAQALEALDNLQQCGHDSYSGAAEVDGYAATLRQHLESTAAELEALRNENVMPGFSGNSDTWDPLTDDGDALRLAVKLGLWVASDNDLGQTFVADDPEGGGRVALIEWHSHFKCPYAATRRAIVRAAAELGRRG